MAKSKNPVMAAFRKVIWNQIRPSQSGLTRRFYCLTASPLEEGGIVIKNSRIVLATITPEGYIRDYALDHWGNWDEQELTQMINDLLPAEQPIADRLQIKLALETKWNISQRLLSHQHETVLRKAIREHLPGELLRLSFKVGAPFKKTPWWIATHNLMVHYYPLFLEVQERQPKALRWLSFALQRGRLEALKQAQLSIDLENDQNDIGISMDSFDPQEWGKDLGIMEGHCSADSTFSPPQPVDALRWTRKKLQSMGMTPRVWKWMLKMGPVEQTALQSLFVESLVPSGDQEKDRARSKVLFEVLHYLSLSPRPLQWYDLRWLTVNFLDSPESWTALRRPFAAMLRELSKRIPPGQRSVTAKRVRDLGIGYEWAHVQCFAKEKHRGEWALSKSAPFGLWLRNANEHNAVQRVQQKYAGSGDIEIVALREKRLLRARMKKVSRAQKESKQFVSRKRM